MIGPNFEKIALMHLNKIEQRDKQLNSKGL